LTLKGDAASLKFTPVLLTCLQSV